MLITCLRHATAQMQMMSINDAERELIKKGVSQIRRVAKFCHKNGLLPTSLYSSPLVRAEQTANLLQAYLPDCPVVQVVDWLALGFEPQNTCASLRMLEKSGGKDVWLVGHEPDISGLLARLLNAPKDFIEIKKASLTRIQVDFSNPSKSQLLWTIPCGLMH
jgi:phosphohistidine phosphatase SixA